MRIAVLADDGDEVSISADVICAEQAVVTLTIENPVYDPEKELESLTLTVEKARELAKALVSVAEAIEFVNTPSGSLNWTVDTAYIRNQQTGLNGASWRDAAPAHRLG